MTNNGPRSIANDVTLSLGILSSMGTLYPMENTEDARETKTFLITPCEHHSRVEQFYVPSSCDCMPAEQPKGYKTGELARGTLVDKKVVPLDDAALAAARESELEKRLLDLQVCDAADFESNSWPAGKAYFFEPHRVDKGYAAMVTLVVDRSRAFYGQMRLRSEGLYRLIPAPWGGLVFQECLTPRQMWHYNAPSFEITEKDATMATAFADAVSEAFDPDAVTSASIERVRALIASSAGFDPVTTQVKAAPPKDEDLSDLLAAALAAAQAKKVA